MALSSHCRAAVRTAHRAGAGIGEQVRAGLQGGRRRVSIQQLSGDLTFHVDVRGGIGTIQVDLKRGYRADRISDGGGDCEGAMTKTSSRPTVPGRETYAAKGCGASSRLIARSNPSTSAARSEERRVGKAR